MRCPDCSKFVSLEMQEPEVEEPEVDASVNDTTGAISVTISVTARIVRACADCGTELKEASFDLETELEIDPDRAAPHVSNSDGKFVPAEGCELEVEVDDAESIEESGGRYVKSYFGVTVPFVVSCSCSDETLAEGELSDKIAASGMDEMV